MSRGLGDVYKRQPIVDDITEVSYLDIQLAASKHFQHELTAGNNSFIYVFEGDGKFNGQYIPANALIQLGTGDNTPDFTAGKEGARFLLVSGKPINESVVQYGPFVMNSREEIDEAMHDYQSNNFVRDRAWIKNR